MGACPRKPSGKAIAGLVPNSVSEDKCNNFRLMRWFAYSLSEVGKEWLPAK
jgi:hypothetical protein